MRPLPRYVLAIMAAFVAFELWIPLLAIVLRALVGPTIPTAVQAVVPLFGLAVPAVVGLALSDYLADRQGLVRPYQPKRRPSDLHQEEEGEDLEGEEDLEGHDDQDADDDQAGDDDQDGHDDQADEQEEHDQADDLRGGAVQPEGAGNEPNEPEDDTVPRGRHRGR